MRDFSDLKSWKLDELLDEYINAVNTFVEYGDMKSNPNWSFEEDDNLGRYATAIEKEIYRRCGEDWADF